MAFQMGITVMASAWGGVKLDEYLQWKFPVFTVVFSLLGVTLAVYISIRDFIKKDK